MRQRPAIAATPEAKSAPFPDLIAHAGAVWLGVELDSVAENLALDEAILAEAHEGLIGTAVVRTWMPRTLVVVVGSSGRLDEEVDRKACTEMGVQIVRRPSGGGTVLVGPGCLMWSVVSPYPQSAPAIDRIHADMLGPLCSAIAAGGLPIERRGSSDLVLLTAMGAMKVSGNALRVRRNASLYHGTLLDHFDIALVSRLLRHPPREPDYRERRSHGAFLANLELGRHTLDQLIQRAYGASSTRTDWPRHRVAELMRDRYESAEWTARL